MKTNVKTSRFPLALALITAEDFSIDYFYQGKHHCVDSDNPETGLNKNIESKIQSVLSRVQVDSARAIIILSSQLTLYSQLVLPSDLSDVQIAELVNLQLSNRDDSGQISTFYDYFQLKAAASGCTFGLIEARKDQVSNWINLLRSHGLETVALLSQPLVFINYIIKNARFHKREYKVVCILPTRFIIACVEQNRVQSIFEHGYSLASSSDGSLTDLIVQHLEDESSEVTQPVIILDTVGGRIEGQLPANFLKFTGYKKEQVLGENTFTWLRSENDMYQSVTLA